MSVYRIYAEKKKEFAVEAQSVLNDIKTALRINITNVRIFNRYDADKLSEEDFEAAISTVFSEPAVDLVYREMPQPSYRERYAVPLSFYPLTMSAWSHPTKPDLR